MLRRVYSWVNCRPRSSAFLPLGRPTTYSCARAVATYPSPGTYRSGGKGRRKKYNFLNNERLVEEEKGLRSRKAIRLRDDVFYHRRVEFRETVKNSVEKYIRYFPENIKQYVFYKNKVGNMVNCGFHGMRKAPGFVSRRILQFVENDVLKPENRAHLLEMIKTAGATPPSSQEWEEYTDKKTGEININLYYHPKLESQLRTFCLSRKGVPSSRMFQAFFLLHRNNFDVCPPMRMWSLRQGPIREEELVERSSQKVVRDVARELANFQQPHVMRAFKKLSPEEKAQTLAHVETRYDEIRRAYERERLFAAKLLCGVTALKEVRAMTSPAITYYNQEYYKYLIRHGGSVEATLRRSKDEVPSWYTLSKETRMKFYCFECSMEMHPVGGAHLYLRYGCRDYGFSREESMEKWATLSDLQKAALNFCFYAPITPPRRATSAFRRFYINQCHLHGLVMTGKACGNRAFFLRARKIWMAMDAEKRAQYEDTESFSSVFPLHPTASSKNKGSVSSTDHAVHVLPPSSPDSATDSKSNNVVNAAEVVYFEDGDIDADDGSDAAGVRKPIDANPEAHITMRSQRGMQVAFIV